MRTRVETADLKKFLSYSFVAVGIKERRNNWVETRKEERKYCFVMIPALVSSGSILCKINMIREIIGPKSLELCIAQPNDLMRLLRTRTDWIACEVSTK